jgi:RNA polymerase sigma factor (sigma-70 family)
MASRSDELCPNTLFHTLTREPSQAFAWFYDKLFDQLVKRIILEFNISEVSAKDLASVALTKVLSVPLSQHRNRSFCEFLGFCTVTANRTAIDSRKRAKAFKRGGGLIESLDQEDVECRIQHDTLWASSGMSESQMSALLEAMMTLTASERIIIEYHYFEGESLESIGNRYFEGTSPSTLFEWKRRALKKLRAALEQLEELR